MLIDGTQLCDKKMVIKKHGLVKTKNRGKEKDSRQMHDSVTEDGINKT